MTTPPLRFEATFFGHRALAGEPRGVVSRLATDPALFPALDAAARGPVLDAPRALLVGGLVEVVGGRARARARSEKFGELAIAWGMATRPQLEAGLTRQRDLARQGRYMWIGEILIDAGVMRPSEVQQVLRLQKARMGVAGTRSAGPDASLGPRPGVRLPPGDWPDAERMLRLVDAGLTGPAERAIYEDALARHGAPGAALHELGACYAAGAGVPGDPRRAERCFRIAAAMGPPGVPSAYLAPLAIATYEPDAAAACAWRLYGLAAHARYAAGRLATDAGGAYERALRAAADVWPAWLPAAARAEARADAERGHAGARALLALDLPGLDLRPSPEDDGMGLALRHALLAVLADDVAGGLGQAGMAPALGCDAAPGDAPALGGARAG